MFLLLILNDCCSDVIIGEASDVFGYRVWFLVYRVWCFHPSRTGCRHPASVSILPDYFISILVSSLLVVVHPVVHSRYWFAVGILSRRPKPLDRRDLSIIDRYLYCSDRRAVGVSRQLSR